MNAEDKYQFSGQTKRFRFLKSVGLVASIIGFLAFSPSKKTKHNTTAPKIVVADTLALRDSLVSFGIKLLGTPYVYGGCSTKGFDCTGFVCYVYRHFQMEVPRSSSAYESFGREIAIDSVKKGDILVFLSPTRKAIGHVGIVTNPKGMESEFIHASSSSAMSVITSSLTQKNYKRRFVKAVTVF